MTRQALYRFFDESDELLYVGVTMNPTRRWLEHSQDKVWWAEVAHVTLEPYPDRKSVLDAEQLAIKTEHPRYNIAGAEPERVVRVETELIWNCWQCGDQIDPPEGHIYVKFADIQGTQADLDEWEDEYGEALHTWDDIMRKPGPVRWMICHDVCDPDPDADGYFIPLRRLRTPMHMLAWTAHLMAKNWLPLTDWDDLLDRITGGLPA